MTPVETADTTRTVPNGWGGNQPLPISEMQIGFETMTQVLLKLDRAEWRELGKPGRVISLVICGGSISAKVREIGEVEP